MKVFYKILLDEKFGLKMKILDNFMDVLFDNDLQMINGFSIS